MSEIATFLPGLIAAWMIQAASAATPGPVVMTILACGGSGHRGKAIRVAAGTATAAFLLACLTALGLSALVLSLGWGLTALRWIGAAVLLWLAWRSFRSAMAPPNPVHATPLRRPYLAGLVLGASSPKALAFWMAIAAVAFGSAAPWPVILVFAAGAFGVSFVIHLGWALALSMRPVQNTYARMRRGIEAALGAVFAVFAFRLALDRS